MTTRSGKVYSKQNLFKESKRIKLRDREIIPIPVQNNETIAERIKTTRRNQIQKSYVESEEDDYDFTQDYVEYQRKIRVKTERKKKEETNDHASQTPIDDIKDNEEIIVDDQGNDFEIVTIQDPIIEANSILILPTEIIQRIYNFLPLVDAYKASSVCRMMRSILSDPHFFNEYSQKQHKVFIPERLLKDGNIPLDFPNHSTQITVNLRLQQQNNDLRKYTKTFNIHYDMNIVEFSELVRKYTIQKYIDDIKNAYSYVPEILEEKLKYINNQRYHMMRFNIYKDVSWTFTNYDKATRSIYAHNIASLKYSYSTDSVDIPNLKHYSMEPGNNYICIVNMLLTCELYHIDDVKIFLLAAAKEELRYKPTTNTGIIIDCECDGDDYKFKSPSSYKTITKFDMNFYNNSYHRQQKEDPRIGF
jgi:hypothetical protein